MGFPPRSDRAIPVVGGGHRDSDDHNKAFDALPPPPPHQQPPPLKGWPGSTLSLSDYASSRTTRTTPADHSRRDLIVISAYSDETYSDAEQRQYGFYDLEADGALRAGGQVSLFTRHHFGLVLNYAGIGLLYGALPATILPFMKYYLGMESYQVHAATAIVNTAWSFKTFGGIVTDSFPIVGYRRKSYMVLGWLLCLACLLALALYHMPGTYYKPGTRVVANPGARHDGWKYALTMAGATFGYFFVNVASDGMVVELAQREPMYCRGATQTIIYATRSLFMTIADVFIGAVFNDKRFGGTFDFSLDYNVVMMILAACAVVPLVGSVLLLVEDKEFPHITFKTRCRDMWRIAQSRAVWQVLLFELVTVFCLGFGSSASVSVATNWARIEPFHKGIANVVTGLVYTASLYVVKMYLLQVNWVRGFCGATVWIIFIRFVYVSSTVFDIVRNQFFWFYIQTFSQPALALRFLLFTFPITEIAEVGYEGTTFGLVTTFHNMAIPLSTSAYKSVGSYFNLTDDKIHADTTAVRWTVYYSYLAAWAVQLSSLLALFLLPRQKLEMQQLRYYGGQSRVAGALVVVALVLILVYSTTTNALSLFPSTACLRIAGGNGCSRAS